MSKGKFRQEQRRIIRKQLNASLDANPRVVIGYGGVARSSLTGKEDAE